MGKVSTPLEGVTRVGHIRFSFGLHLDKNVGWVRLLFNLCPVLSVDGVDSSILPLCGWSFNLSLGVLTTGFDVLEGFNWLHLKLTFLCLCFTL